MLVAYIHGFLSGPNAQKALILKRFLAENFPSVDFEAADFPDTPAEAIAALDIFVRERMHRELVLVGSSMGGFMSTVLQSRYGMKTVLINPCVHPQDYFADLLGPQHNDHNGRDFVLKPHMITTLKELDQESFGFDAAKTTVFLQSGDEVLDYRKALDFYKGADVRVEEGGCHAFNDFERVCPLIARFAGADR